MIKEIVRLHKLNHSKRAIARALGISRNTVDKYLSIEQTEYTSERVYSPTWSNRFDWREIKESIEQGFTLQDIWESHASKLTSYSSFWREFRRRFPDQSFNFHRTHIPGDRCEIDFKGDAPGLGYYDRSINEFVECRLFGAVSCFSQCLFARASISERQIDWLEGTAKAYQYFGGCPKTLIVDNAKALVTRAHRYDPDLNKELGYFCAHYDVAPMPARPRKPKDKNTIEQSLGTFWRWAKPRLKGNTCYSIEELNKFLEQLVTLFNKRNMRKYGVSRHERLMEEQGEFVPLPEFSYSPATWKRAKVHPDCHIQINFNFYSVPFCNVGKSVDVRETSKSVYIFHAGDLIGVHPRFTDRKGRYATILAHLPEAHKAIVTATPSAIKRDAKSVGPATELIIYHMIDEQRHPYMLLRRSQGILRLAKRYSSADLETAAAIMVETGNLTPKLKDIEEVIKLQNNPDYGTVTPISRGPNPYLRGQKSWKITEKRD